MALDSMENIEGVQMPGMIGFETFRRFVTRIDYGNKTITLINPKDFDAEGRRHRRADRVRRQRCRRSKAAITAYPASS